jgi:hypothetical protein
MGAAAAGAAAGAAANGASRTSAGAQAVAASVPQATTAKPATSPTDWFKKLDTGAKVGIGAGALALLIGVGWLASGGGSNSPPGPIVATPNVTIGPDGTVDVRSGDRTTHVGPDGVRVGVPPSPGVPPAPGTGDTRAPFMPGDGDVIPGREGAPSGSASVPSGGDYNAVTASDIAGILSEAGHQTTTGTDNDGDPMIRGTVQGFKYEVFFYRCNGAQGAKRCLDLQFHSTFTNDRNVGETDMNAYNRDNRFGQAYFTRSGEIGLDMSATLQGGVTRQHIKEVIDWWKVTLTGFPSKIGSGGG